MAELILSDTEQKLIDLYRKADNLDKASILLILGRYETYKFNPRVIEGGKAKKKGRQDG